MNWIKTSEQLPPKDCYVLAICDDVEFEQEQNMFAIVKLTDNADYPFSGIVHNYKTKEVHYWSHLPTPPKE